MKHLIFATILFFLISCQRDTNTNDPSGTTATCKLKTVTYNFSPTNRVYNVVYTGDNISELASSVDNTLYTYNPAGKLIKKETYNTGNTQVQFKTEFTYDAGGLLTEELNYEFFGGLLQATSKYTFQYSNGKRSQVSHYGNGWTTYRGKTIYTWTGDNITSISFYDDTNTLECTTTFTYDLTKENSFYIKFNTFYLQDLYDEDLTHIYFLSKNQLTSHSSSCPTPETDNWTYTYNSRGLTKTVSISEDGAVPFTMWTFTYTCD